jgi:hypothetical protein
MRGLRRSHGGAQVDEHVDVATVLAQALNRLPPEPEAVALPELEPVAIALPEPEAVASAVPEPEPLVSAAPEPEPVAPAEPEPVTPPADPGAIIRVPLSTAPGSDQLADDLLALGMSLSYDVSSNHGALWREIVVELPPGQPPDFAADMGGSWLDFRPSMHSRGCVDVLWSQLQEVDPDTGFDVVLRAREMVLCRWPSRAWDVRDPEPVQPPPPPEPEHAEPDPKLRRRFRRRVTAG